MDEIKHITRRIGQILVHKFDDSLRRPMDWQMIDALAKLDEAEERATCQIKRDPIFPPSK